MVKIGTEPRKGGSGETALATILREPPRPERPVSLAEKYRALRTLAVRRELALVKVKGTGEKRVEALRLADVFRAKVIDAKTDSFVFEVTGTSDKVHTFIGLMGALGLVDVGRTGIVAMTRGGEAL